MLVRRNYNSAYLAHIGEPDTNGRLVRRNGKLLRRSRFDLNVHSECFAPGYIPIPTYTLGTNQAGEPTCTPGAWSVWSPPNLSNSVEDFTLENCVYGGDYRGGDLDPGRLDIDSFEFTGYQLAHWLAYESGDGTYGQHDQILYVFEFWLWLDKIWMPRWIGAPNKPPAAVPDWFWAAKVRAALSFEYRYFFAGGEEFSGVGGYYRNTESGDFESNFGYGVFGNPGHVEASAWIYGAREQHRIRGTGLEIYGHMADFTSDLDTSGTYPSASQGKPLFDTWLRNEIAGIYLQLTTSNATPWDI